MDAIDMNERKKPNVKTLHLLNDSGMKIKVNTANKKYFSSEELLDVYELNSLHGKIF